MLYATNPAMSESGILAAPAGSGSGRRSPRFAGSCRSDTISAASMEDVIEMIRTGTARKIEFLTKGIARTCCSMGGCLPTIWWVC
jgi:hypothetical protein